MKMFFYILLLFSSLAQGQTTWQMLGAGGQKRAYPKSTRLDSVINRVDSVKSALANVSNTSDANKPISNATQAALDGKAAASHSHTIANVTGLQAALDAKGTSNFDGVYSSLTGKPSLFDGAYNSLSGKPDLSVYSLTSHTHSFAQITSPPTTVAGYGITDAPKIVAAINLTTQAANIGTTTLYAVPSAGFYRISIYITVTSAGTTSTMPSTTITYTDGNAGTNSHSTTTTATNTGNSVTTTFLQTTYLLYAKASTNIQYATGGYASTGSAMQYALRIRVEAL